jgi:cation:H+ antiporter
MNEWLLVGAGLLLLLAGGEALVRGSVTLATRLGISPLIVGLTLVGFGTSAPELATSVEAALRGSPDIAIGNVVGSNIANILLILGIAALLQPLACPRNAIVRDGAVASAAALLTAGVALYGGMPRAIGATFFALLLVYLGTTYRAERNTATPSADLHRKEGEFVAPLAGPVWQPLLLSLAGLIGIVIGASLLVDGAIIVAREAGIPETIIGLTLVAVGTSLPELAVTVVAAIRRQLDVALGNIIGSNIFNILGILGVTAMVQPLSIPDQVVRFDIWVMLAATAAMILFATTRMRIDRWEGGILLSGYALYLWAQFDPQLRAVIGLAGD